MIVQIYAFTRPEDAVRAAQLGVDHIGVVVGQYGQVHGEVSFEQARRIKDVVGEMAKMVALTMSTEVDEIARMGREVQPDIVHISSGLREVGERKVRHLRDQLPDHIRIMKALPVTGERSIQIAQSFAGLVDLLILDSKVKGMPGVGATGVIHDWTVSRAIAETVEIPVILAGGLSPRNVAKAIETVQPWGVDSNTATNLAGDPVTKDFDKIASFVKAVRSVERPIL